jgi:hypothetical protein
MSDLFNIIEDLSVRARMEETPAVDVAAKVVSRLGREARQAVWPLAVFASGATVCAVVVLGLSLPLMEMFTDPLSAFFVAAMEVLH